MIKKALKGSLAAAAGIALALGAGSVASAQDDVSTAASGNVVYLGEGIALNGGAGHQDVRASLLGLELGEDDTRVVYCIQINVALEDGYLHEERAWADVEVEDLPKVLGVLLAGYNGSNGDDLLAAAGASGDFEGWSSDQIAYAGTQAAIWSLTDDWVIADPDATEGGADLDAAVLAVQTYLLENSEPAEEPDMDPYFEVDDSEATVDGATVGPYTVSTNFGKIAFSQPEGATIVDENGEAISEFTDGLTIYVQFDSAESSTVSIATESVVWTTPVGRVFVPVEGGETQVGQNLILGEAHEEEIAAEVEFELVIEEVPSETPAAPKLPTTGASLTMVAGIGGAVVAAGVVAIVLMRRRAATAGGDWGEDG